MKVTIDIPDSVERALHDQVGGDLEKAAKESLAIVVTTQVTATIGKKQEKERLQSGGILATMKREWLPRGEARLNPQQSAFMRVANAKPGSSAR